MRIDTTYYNRENLHEEDRKELDYWRSAMLNAIDNILYYDYEDNEGILAKIRGEVAEEFAEKLRVELGYRLMDALVGIMDGYDEAEEIPERDEYTTYYYDEVDYEDN